MDEEQALSIGTLLGGEGCLFLPQTFFFDLNTALAQRRMSLKLSVSTPCSLDSSFYLQLPRDLALLSCPIFPPLVIKMGGEAGVGWKPQHPA